MGKFWRSEAILECDLVEKSNPQENQPWRDAYKEFRQAASRLFADWIASFHSAARLGGFEVRSGYFPGANPFEYYASYKIKDDSEYYATRPFHVRFKLALPPSGDTHADYRNLVPRFGHVRFEDMYFESYADQSLGVVDWCKTFQRHKITGRYASSPLKPEQNWKELYIANRKMQESKLAVLWYTGEEGNEFIGLEASPLSPEAEAYGDYIQLPHGHYKIWDQYNTVGPQAEYVHFPRARILYKTSIHAFVVIGDKRIVGSKKVRAQLRERYHLPQPVIFKTDWHYQ